MSIKKIDLMEYEDKKYYLDSLKESLKKKKEEFEESTKDLVSKIKSVEDELSSKKEIIEEQAKSEFYLTGKKKLLGEIGIQERNVLSYDEEKAFEWAKKSGTCLLLDKKTFEKVGPTMTNLITVEKKVVVTFPKVIKIKLEE